MSEYAMVIYPLSEEDGGGYLASYPDLPGCFSDGETVEEALENSKDAFAAWMEVQSERGVDIPEPGAASNEVTDKIKSLMDALKAVVDYADAADSHIDYLEETLEKAVAKLEAGWQVTGATIAGIAKKQSRDTPIH